MLCTSGRKTITNEDATVAIKKFRRGETTYTCQSCRKVTRNVGGDEAGCRLCLDCYNLAGTENYLSDNGEEDMLANYGDEARGIFARRPELREVFPEVARVVDFHNRHED